MTTTDLLSDFNTNPVCHVWSNFYPSYTCWTTVIFDTLKDGSLEMNIKN